MMLLAATCATAPTTAAVRRPLKECRRPTRSTFLPFCSAFSRTCESVFFPNRHLEVRILSPQPGSHSARDCKPMNPISARQLRLFCELAVHLYTPNLHNLGAKSAIVSGYI